MTEILPKSEWTKDNIQEQYKLLNRALGIAQKANDPTMRKHYYDLEGEAISWMNSRGIRVPH